MEHVSILIEMMNTQGDNSIESNFIFDPCNFNTCNQPYNHNQENVHTQKNKQAFSQPFAKWSYAGQIRLNSTGQSTD